MFRLSSYMLVAMTSASSSRGLPQHLLDEWDFAANHGGGGQKRAPTGSDEMRKVVSSTETQAGWLFDEELLPNNRAVAASVSSSRSSSLPHPSEISPQSPRFAKWVCKTCQKTWSARISERCDPATDLGCPSCTLDRVKKNQQERTSDKGKRRSAASPSTRDPNSRNSNNISPQSHHRSPCSRTGLLVDDFPQIAAEWAEDRNSWSSNQELHLLTSDSMAPVWWRCSSCNGEWLASAGQRTTTSHHHRSSQNDHHHETTSSSTTTTDCPKCVALHDGTATKEEEPQHRSRAVVNRNSASRSTSGASAVRGTLGRDRPDLLLQVYGLGIPMTAIQQQHEITLNHGKSGAAHDSSPLKIAHEYASRLPVTSSTNLIWKCPSCTHCYKMSVRERTQLGSDCPACSGTTSAGDTATMTKTGRGSNPTRSVVYLRPDVFREVLAFTTREQELARLASPTSSQVFRFRCSKCGGMYKMSMRERCFAFSDRVGCPSCRFVSQSTVGGGGSTVSAAHSLQMRRSASDIAHTARIQGRQR